MLLADVLNKLNDEEKSVVTEAIEAEKSRGIDESRKKGQSVQKYMTESNRLKDILRNSGIDPDEDIEQQLTTLKDGLKEKPKSDLERQVLTLSKQVKILTDGMAEKTKEAETEKGKYRNTKLTQVLGTSLGEKIHASDFVIKGLIRDGKVKLDENENPVWVDGETETEFGKGVELFLKQNNTIVKTTQTPGTGSSPGSGKSAKTMARAEFDSLAPADRMSFMKDGGKINN